MSLPSVDEARRRMLSRIAPLPTERVRLSEALGRVLAADVVATRDQPPFASSAMDGWAVRRADAMDAARELLIVGESAAGHGWRGELAAGQAVRISTGAPLPAGADWVVIQENACVSGGQVRVGPLCDEPNYVRPKAGDFASGRPLLRGGERLDPWRLALAAAAGWDSVEVGGKPLLTLLTTGDEVVAPGSTAGPLQIFDAAGAGLQASCRSWGADVRSLAAGDREAEVAAALTSTDGDLIVTVGGASVGDHDVVKPALRAFGLTLDVEGVAVRPGKPTWFGGLSDGRLVLGLPGNPASALVCAELFLRPLIAALQGADAEVRFLAARAQEPLPAPGAREHLMRGRVWIDDGGVLCASASEQQDSSLVTVLARSNALIRRPAGSPAAEVGELVDVLWLNTPDEVSRTLRPGLGSLERTRTGPS